MKNKALRVFNKNVKAVSYLNPGLLKYKVLKIVYSVILVCFNKTESIYVAFFRINHRVVKI